MSEDEKTVKKRRSGPSPNKKVPKIIKIDYTIEILNPDCLAHVFSFLSAVDRINLAKVSKKLVAASEMAWHNVKEVHFPDSSEHPEEVREASMEVYDHSQKIIKKVIAECGNNLRCLTMTADENFWPMLPLITEKCPNLTKLVVSILIYSKKNYEGKLSGFTKLKSIGLNVKRHGQHQRKVSFTTAILETIPEGIEEISFRYMYDEPCWLNPTPQFRKIFLNWKSLHSLTLQNWKMNDRMMSVLGEKVELKHLDLLDSCPREDRASALANLVNLESLKLKPAWGRGDNWTHTQIVEFPFYNSINDNLIARISTSCKQLKHLSLMRVTLKQLTCKGLSCLANLEHLEEVVISYSGASDAVLEGFKNLKYFDCTGCEKVTDDGIMGVIGRSPDLDKIFVDGTSASAGVLQYVAEVNANLL